MENNPPKNNYTIAISIVVAAIVVGGAIVWAVGNKSNTTPQATSSQTSSSVSQITPQDVILGNKNAPVTVIEYGDYQCPYCAEFFNNIEPALKVYVQSGKINMIFREMSFIGSESQMAAEASYCAADQGKFWEYHDLVYQTKYDDYFKNGGKENDGSLSNNALIGLADQLKLDHNQFVQCLSSQKYVAAVSSDNQAAQTLGVNSTPTVFINGQEMPAGVGSVSDYQKAIDNALSAAGK